MFLPQPITFNMFLPVGGTLGLVIQLVNRSRNNLDNLKTHNHPVLSVVFDIINYSNYIAYLNIQCGLFSSDFSTKIF